MMKTHLVCTVRHMYRHLYVQIKYIEIRDKLKLRQTLGLTYDIDGNIVQYAAAAANRDKNMTMFNFFSMLSIVNYEEEGGEGTTGNTKMDKKLSGSALPSDRAVAAINASALRSSSAPSFFDAEDSFDRKMEEMDVGDEMIVEEAEQRNFGFGANYKIDDRFAALNRYKSDIDVEYDINAKNSCAGNQEDNFRTGSDANSSMQTKSVIQSLPMKQGLYFFSILKSYQIYFCHILNKYICRYTRCRFIRIVRFQIICNRIWYPNL